MSQKIEITFNTFCKLDHFIVDYVRISGADWRKLLSMTLMGLLNTGYFFMRLDSELLYNSSTTEYSITIVIHL